VTHTQTHTHTHTHTHTYTLDRTPLGERPARRRDLYLTTQNIRMRQISMSPEGFEPAIPLRNGRKPTPYTARLSIYHLP